MSTRTFASLHVYNFRLFWAASLISSTAGWASLIAQDWLVLTILTDNSAAALGVVTGLQFLPIPLATPFAGALADRFSKRRVLEVTQALLMLNSVVLAVLVTLGAAELWHVFALAVLTGTIQSFDGPARQAIVAEMVPERLLPNAVGLNSMQFNGARLVGPAISGLLIGAFGVTPSLWINVVSFVFPILALALLRPDELAPAKRSAGKGAVRAGFSYVRKRPDLLMIFFVVFMLGTFGLNFQLTNALMATEVYGLGAESYGFLGSMMAAGTLTGAVLAARRGYPRLGLIVGALGGFALFEMILAFAPWYWLYALLLTPTGLLAITVMTTANSRVQLTTEPEMRGRVMALYMAIFLGGTPVGAPVVGWIGELWGARSTLLVGAAATALTMLLAGVFLLRTAESYPAPLHFLEAVRDRVRNRRA
ncbi:MFS transporter [Tessaracoccus sp. OH4464_COT-324]|uniref:MFS transporter n=1 Tax=Tessaracoccus sp. OH4464_COT-324 TaxID=2491059 RepID=UPI000F6403CA|nr:MFS transporter [Tessaracoccus sp. OH4464_COT-324]RRD46987.1 MFS transporter [Tessaracoccus sp. OH4464_COT-324]